MRAVDEKILRLKMENADFKNKASESVSLLGRLNSIFSKVKNLNLDKSVKGLNDVNDASKRTTLNALTEGISTVTTKFSAMNVVAMAALANITNRAVNAGIQLTQALTVQPMTDGFNEYELKMKSIQTIMSNTKDQGTSLKEVTDILDELNVYADKTIYSFADMTSNIGTFTAAGVGLEDSATAIQGISNLAAASGSNTQQASSAMYQLSQALANGKVNLQDWNSVVNAGMGGKLFQNALQKTAEGMGQNIDKSISFRDSLESGWLTTDVLIKTLGEFAKDQSMLEAATKVRTFTQLVDTAREALGSGWAVTWETIFGGFEEAGDMWTKANDAISGSIEQSAKNRNALMEDFVKLGGRTALINTVANTFKFLSQMVKAVKDGMHDIFPPVTANQLLKMAKAVENFTKGLIMNFEQSEKVRTIFKGLFSVLDSGIYIAKSIGFAIKNIIPEGTGGAIMDLLVWFSKLLIAFNEGLKGSEGFKNALEMLSSALKKTLEKVKDFGKGTEDSFKKVKAFFKGLGSGFGALANTVGPIFDWFVKNLSKLGEMFDFRDVMTVGFLAVLIKGFKKFSKLGDGLKDMMDKIGGFGGSIADAIQNIGGISDALSAMTSAVNTASLVGIAVAVGILALSLGKISKLKAGDIAKGLEVIGVSLLMLNLSLKAISKLDFGGGMMKASAVMIATATSLLILSNALENISGLNPDELARGLTGLTGTMVLLIGAMKIMSSTSGKMSASSLQLIAIATSMTILASAVKKLAEIDSGGLVKGVSSIGIILLELGVFLKIADGTKFKPSTAAGLVVTTGAIMVMVSAIKRIADIKVSSIEKGLVTIGLILTELGLFTKLVSGSKMTSASVGLATTAGAITLLIVPMERFGSMNMESIGKGLGVMAGALGLIVASMKLASGSLGGAAAIVTMSVAINALVPPILVLGSLSITQIATSLGVLAGAFIIMGGAAKIIGITGATALLSFAAAIGAVGLAIGLIGVGFLGFGVALTTLAGLTVGGVAAIILNLGLLLTGIGTLIPKLANLALQMVVAMAKSIASGVPQLASSALTLILGLLTALRNYVPEIVTVGLELVTALANALADNVGDLIDAGVNLIVELITGMADGIRQNQELIIGAVLSLMEAILEILITGLQAVIDVFFGWIPGVSKATKGLGDTAKGSLQKAFNATDLAKIGDDGATSYKNAIDNKNGDTKETAKKLGTAAKDGISTTFNKVDLDKIGAAGAVSYTTAISNKNGEAKKTGTNLGNNAKTGAGSVSLTEKGTKAGQEFVNGVSNKKSNAKSAGSGLGSNAKSGAGSISLNQTGLTSGQSFVNGVNTKNSNARTAGSSLGSNADSGARTKSLNSAGSWAGQGFVDGLASKASDVWDAAASLASKAVEGVEKLLKIKSPSRVMREDGGWFGEGFRLGIEDQESGVEKTASSLGRTAMEATTSWVDAIMNAFDENYELQPTITPVIDARNLTGYSIPDKFKIPANSVDGAKGKTEVSITINGYNKDPKVLAKEIERIIVRGVQS